MLTVIISGTARESHRSAGESAWECLRRMKRECGGRGWRSKKYSVVSVGRGWALYITPRPLAWTDLQKAPAPADRGNLHRRGPWQQASAEPTPQFESQPLQAPRMVLSRRRSLIPFPDVPRAVHPSSAASTRPVKKPRDSSGRSKRENAPVYLQTCKRCGCATGKAI